MFPADVKSRPVSRTNGVKESSGAQAVRGVSPGERGNELTEDVIDEKLLGYGATNTDRNMQGRHIM